MKAFTLIEIAVVILIITILSGIAFRFTAFSPETLYLKNFVYKLGSNINFLKDFSLSRKEVDSNKACGYGMRFSASGYFGYVFATSSVLDCDTLALFFPASFASFSPIFYLHTNGDIRQDPIGPLQIKDDFKPGLSMRISSFSPTCSDNLFSSYPEIDLVYYNPYGDLLLLGKSGNWTNLLPSDWQNIFFCFEYKGEKRYLRINRSGQMLIINP
jgi:prepilin-type N-terminal cleavage/methylation domain-containing protein